MARSGDTLHAGTYKARAAYVRARANANPDTRCWRCGRTLDEHEPHASGRRPWWEAGHIDGHLERLAPEASICNHRANAIANNNRAQPTSEVW
jgi:hypothetical protein